MHLSPETLGEGEVNRLPLSVGSAGRTEGREAGAGCPAGQGPTGRPLSAAEGRLVP